MKNKMWKSMILLSMFVLLSACSSNGQGDQTTTVSTNETGHSEELADNVVRLTVSMDNGSQFVNEQEVEIEEGANLLDVMKETFFVETNDENEITSIERMQIDEEENTSWVLFVNDEISDTPAKDYMLNGGEKIVFDLQ